jgi:precorrin-2/cobalt-factor-2 C20-methyltransferase
VSGRLYGLGIGPGDAELLTLKAVRLLGQVAVVAYPIPASGVSLARSIVADHLPTGIVELPLPLPFDGKGGAEAAYDQAAAAIAAHLDAGRDVAALCEGDPFLYGTFIHLHVRLGRRYRVEVVPGVSSVMAAAALAGMPLAARDDALVIIPAVIEEAAIERLLATAQAAAILKVGRHLGKVRAVLARLGLEDSAICVERAGQPGESVRPVAGLAEAPYFAVILVHKDRPPCRA